MKAMSLAVQISLTQHWKNWFYVLLCKTPGFIKIYVYVCLTACEIQTSY